MKTIPVIETDRPGTKRCEGELAGKGTINAVVFTAVTGF
jgi:hypothetical protein